MNQLPNIHPGELLREEFLIPLQISQYRLAKEIGVTEARISTICAGKRDHSRHGFAPGGVLRHHARLLAWPASRLRH